MSRVDIVRDQEKKANFVDFDILFMDEDSVWHDCPDTPFIFPVDEGLGPKAFRCMTNVPATKLKFVARTAINPQFNEVEIYTPISYMLGRVSEHTIGEFGIGLSPLSLFAATCSLDGCGKIPDTPTVSLSWPDPPSSVNVTVDDDDTLALEVQPPTNTGGLALTEYKILITEKGPTKATVIGSDMVHSVSSFGPELCHDGIYTNYCSTIKPSNDANNK